MSEEEKLDILLELFDWDNTQETRYHALRILRGARRELIPTPDDYAASRVRN